MKKRTLHVILSAVAFAFSLVAVIITTTDFQQMRLNPVMCDSGTFLATFLIMLVSIGCCILCGYAMIFPEEATYPFKEDEEMETTQFPADGKRYIRLPYDWQMDEEYQMMAKVKPFDWSTDEELR